MTEDKNKPIEGAESGDVAKEDAPEKDTAPETEQDEPPAKKTPLRDRKPKSSKIPANTECQNCGSALQGDYCHACGQAAREPRRVVIGLVQDVFVDTLAIDGKLARTIGLLLWRPGTLAKRYLDGKRVSYSPPFRLYLFASVFFFFTTFLLIGAPKDNAESLDPKTQAEVEEALQGASAEIDEAREALQEAGVDIPIGLPQAEEIARDGAAPEGADGEPGEADTGVKFSEMVWADTKYTGPQWLEPHAKRIFEAGQRAAEDPRLFIAEISRNLPRFMLLAPLVYGLILAFLFLFRRNFFIYDHFIISLYMHAALYAYLLLAILVSRAPAIGSFAFIPVLWGVFQPLLVFRQAYESSWLMAFIRWLISSFVYFIAVVLIITLGVSYSLYQS